MKVLMLSKACYVAAYRRKLEELAGLGVDLTLVAPPYWRTGRRKLAFEPANDTGYHTVLQNPLLNGSFHCHFYPRLPTLIHNLHPDLVHIDEEPYDLVTFHAMRAAIASRAKALFFTWQNISRSYPLPFSFFEKETLRHAHGAIAGSRDAAAVLREKGYRRPLYVVPQFGVDPELFPARLPDGIAAFTQDRPFRIGFSGRLVEEKGLLVLLWALRGLEGAWELRLLGDGPLHERLVTEAAVLGIADRVRFLGNVPSGEVAAQLRQFDVLVNPSLTWRHGRSQWKEQFGRSLIEAMASGVPVLGSDSGEIPHVLGDAGLIVPEGDPDRLQAQLQRLMHAPDLRQDLGVAGRARVLCQYTQRAVAAQTYAVYRHLLGQA